MKTPPLTQIFGSHFAIWHILAQGLQDIVQIASVSNSVDCAMYFDSH